ncbi:hypothetical protein D3C81_1059210 [compost metagenome]
MFGGFEALRRVGCQCLLQVVLQPFRQVGAIARGVDRLAEARALEGLHFAVGVMPGQQVIQRHTHGIQVLAWAGRLALECFRGNV